MRHKIPAQNPPVLGESVPSSHKTKTAPVVSRAFKGVWIPAEIWLNPELSITEKVLLVEIESLQSPERGCYASNAHFAKFFGLSPNRVSAIINDLAHRGFVSIKLIYVDKQITERQIRILNGHLKMEGRYSENSERGTPKTEGGYSENSEGSNTKSNNTKSTKSIYGASAPRERDEASNHAFNTAWNLYPKREGSNPKNKALQAWNARLAEGVTPEEMMSGLTRYIGYCDAKGQTGSSFVMQAARFFGTGREFENGWEVSHIQPGGKKAPKNTDDDTSWIYDMEDVL